MLIKKHATLSLFTFLFFWILLPAQSNSEAIKRHRNAAKNIAKVAKVFDAETYINKDSDTLRYRLLKPKNYNPKKKYPIVICLSGSGGRAYDNIKQLAACWPAQILAKPENREKHPCFLFVPQCNPGQSWGISTNRPLKQKLTSIEDKVFEVLKLLEKEFSIDKKRRYVTGQSLGGYGAWHFAIKHPKKFAAIVPICGGADIVFAKKIKNIPIWAFHGEKDTAVPTAYTRDIVNSLKAIDGNVLYNELKGIGHISWPVAYDTPELLDWMFSKKN